MIWQKDWYITRSHFCKINLKKLGSFWIHSCHFYSKWDFAHSSMLEGLQPQLNSLSSVPSSDNWRHTILEDDSFLPLLFAWWLHLPPLSCPITTLNFRLWGRRCSQHAFPLFQCEWTQTPPTPPHPPVTSSKLLLARWKKNLNALTKQCRQYIVLDVVKGAKYYTVSGKKEKERHTAGAAVSSSAADSLRISC